MLDETNKMIHKLFSGGFRFLINWGAYSSRPWDNRGARPAGLIGHFTVMDGSETDGDLALIQTFLLCYVNQVILMLTSIFQGQFP